MCDEMPVFPERESTLISRLHTKTDKSQDKRTWVIGGAAENLERKHERYKGFRKDSGSPVLAEQNPRARVSSNASASATASGSRPPPLPEKPSIEAERKETLIDDMMGPSNGDADDIMSSLADLDLSGGGVQGQPLLNGSKGAVGDAPGGVYVRDEMVQSPIEESPALSPAGNGDFNVLTATLGGVAPALVAPLTKGPNVEKVSHLYEQANRSGLNV